MKQNYFYYSNNRNYHIAANLSVVVMIVVSVYLTANFYEFIGGLTGYGLCNINSYFSCNIIGMSSHSTLMGVPISIFGILMGLYYFLGYLVTWGTFLLLVSGQKLTITF